MKAIDEKKERSSTFDNSEMEKNFEKNLKNA